MGEYSAISRRARDLIALIADRASFRVWDEDVVSSDPLRFVDSRPYTERLTEAQRISGSSEAVVTGRLNLHGRSVAVIVGEFSFLGGSVGVATGERVARAFERAAEQSLPVIGMSSSGGTRMQEGTVAFMQMVKTAAVVKRFRSSGLPYLAYLMHPTMGGVLASWGSLAHFTFAMPGALIGFMGPRVMELAEKTSLPPGTQSAENLYRRGLLDGIFPPEELADRLARLLSVLDRRTAPRLVDDPAFAEHLTVDPGDPWESVQRSRDPERPGARELLLQCATEAIFFPEHGIGRGDSGCLMVVARVGGVPALILAQNRSAASMGPSDFRKARRGIALAGELGLALVTIIDTGGAQISVESEEGGLAAEIARCLGDIIDARSPTLSILLGQGAGGGAIALLPADRVICAEHGWLAPVSPEGASVIVHGVTNRASELARGQGVASWELLRLGIVDVIVPESPTAAEKTGGFLPLMSTTIAAELRALVARDQEPRLAARALRYRATGGRGWAEGGE